MPVTHDGTYTLTGQARAAQFVGTGVTTTGNLNPRKTIVLADIQPYDSLRIAGAATLLFARFDLLSSDLIMPISGNVTAISADSVTLNMDRRSTEGITFEIEITESTLFIRGGKCASWRDVKIGARAKAHVTNNDRGLLALNVVFENPRGRTESSPGPEAVSYDAYWRPLAWAVSSLRGTQQFARFPKS